MPAAGDPVYASDVLRARPTILWDSASGTLAGAVADVDVPGISVVFTTETAGATVAVVWFMQADPTGATTVIISSRPRITGPAAYAVAAPVFATAEQEVATDQVTPGNCYQFTLGVAGTYTMTLRATIPASAQLNVYTTVMATVQEQWS